MKCLRTAGTVFTYQQQETRTVSTYGDTVSTCNRRYIQSQGTTGTYAVSMYNRYIQMYNSRVLKFNRRHTQYHRTKETHSLNVQHKTYILNEQQETQSYSLNVQQETYSLDVQQMYSLLSQNTAINSQHTAGDAHSLNVQQHTHTQETLQETHTVMYNMRHALCRRKTGGRYHGGRRPSSDDIFHSPTVIPPSALHKPSVMKYYHRRRTCSHTSPCRSPTMVTLHDTQFVEYRWWNDDWTVKTVVTWRSSASMITASLA